MLSLALVLAFASPIDARSCAASADLDTSVVVAVVTKVGAGAPFRAADGNAGTDTAVVKALRDACFAVAGVVTVDGDVDTSGVLARAQKASLLAKAKASRAASAVLVELSVEATNAASASPSQVQTVLWLVDAATGDVTATAVERADVASGDAAAAFASQRDVAVAHLAQKATAVWTRALESKRAAAIAAASPLVATGDQRIVSVDVEVDAVAGDDAATLRAAHREARRKVVELARAAADWEHPALRRLEPVLAQLVGTDANPIVNERWGALVQGSAPTKRAIHLDAAVSPRKLEDARCTVVKANFDPKVAIVLAERAGGADAFHLAAPGSPMRDAVVSLWQDACFHIVDATVAGNVGADGAFSKSQLTELTAAAHAAQAQYLVTGIATVEAAIDVGAPSTAPPAWSVALAVTLVDAADGSIVTTSKATTQVAAATAAEALRVAALGPAPGERERR